MVILFIVKNESVLTSIHIQLFPMDDEEVPSLDNYMYQFTVART